ncbi:MAG: acid phosphatase [Candidatus Symbiobacter sp.]|nr:acid phosphatase [Candidatus Symbiobacter sp.]
MNTQNIWRKLCGAAFTLILVASLPNLANAATITAAPDPLDKVKTIVVIYAENRSFDNLYGLFPGANGILVDANNVVRPPNAFGQLDRDGVTLLPHLPKVWSDKTGALDFVANLPNQPFQIDAPPGGLPGVPPGVKTADLVHRFYQNQMQINHGANNQFAAWSDAGGLTMGYYDGSAMQMWKIAASYTLADNFFMGSFGGSLLNHFWLVCACTPHFDLAPASRHSLVDASGTRLVPSPAGSASSMVGPPQFLSDQNLTPDDYAVNAIQPPFQPSGAPPAPGGDPALADRSKFPLPAQNSGQIKTVGDTLSEQRVDWAWYAGAWHQALADRSVIYNDTSPNFQPHHHPFNFFSRFDPTTPQGKIDRARHLKDYEDFARAIQDGTLPPVSFYKPQGNLNQHPGYTDVMSGDAHIAETVRRLQQSPQWKNMVIIVTYDENGGFWDHVAPPLGDRWGPGTRIPAVIISPFAKPHFVDHTYYDTTSIIKFITRRFHLSPLPGVRENAGDLTGALDLDMVKLGD